MTEALIIAAVVVVVVAGIWIALGTERIVSLARLLAIVVVSMAAGIGAFFLAIAVGWIQVSFV